MKSSSNFRVDEYGGCVENRCRLTLAVIDLAIEVFGSSRVGIKISPYDEPNSDPMETSIYLAKELDRRDVGFIEVKESKGPNAVAHNPNMSGVIRPYFRGKIIANDSFTPESGIALIRNGDADMVSFGRLYINNADLAERIINGIEPNTKWSYATFSGYQHGATGYTQL